MKNNSTNILEPIKKVNIFIVTAIILILFCFVLLQTSSKHREKEDKILINIFGKQRMYTQMMSKDANRIYMLLQTLNKGQKNTVERTHAVNSKELTELRHNLIHTRKDFASVLKAVHNKEIHIDKYNVHINAFNPRRFEYLKEIDALWTEFEKAITTIIKSDAANTEMLGAVDYINKNNMRLLELSDIILMKLQNDSLRGDIKTQFLAYTMVGLLFILLIISLINLQRFLVQPFQQLYKGITDIGLNQYILKSQLPTKKKVMPIVADINDMFLKINYLISLIENINNNDSFMEILDYIKQKFSTFIPYNYIGIALISQDKKYLKASYGVTDGTIIGLPDNIVGAIWPVKDTSLKTLINTGEARIINDLEKYCEGKPMKSYNKTLLEAGIRASIAVPLKVTGEPVGMIFFSSSSKNVYHEEHLNFLHTLANSIAISLNKNIFTSEILYSSILALAKLSEARDEDTGEHMERMAKYSRLIAQLLYDNDFYSEEITIEYIDQIERFSPLHDIGKVGIVDGILLKPAKLTPEEFNEMKKHSLFGAEVLRSADKNLQKIGKSAFGMGIDIAEGHHEKWDGTGYPCGRKGSEIPLCARIVALADVFDALTSKRPYKEAFSLDKSFEIIAESSGSHFDPVITKVFIENRNRLEEIFYNFNIQNG